MNKATFKKKMREAVDKDKKKEFVEELTKWYLNQHGACACLGDCPKCGHHICFGCACWIFEKVELKSSTPKKK